jgi:hypothetical protein
MITMEEVVKALEAAEATTKEKRKTGVEKRESKYHLMKVSYQTLQWIITMRMMHLIHQKDQSMIVLLSSESNLIHSIALYP